jgi:replicative DNA helicase
MIDPSTLRRVTRIVKAANFYSDAHRQIFETCLELGAAGLAVDVVAVATRLRDRDQLEAVGGMAHLVEILNAPMLRTPREDLVSARAVRDKACARALLARRSRRSP